MKYKLLSIIVLAFTVAGLFAPQASARLDPGEPVDSCTDPSNCARKTAFTFTTSCGNTNVTIKCMFVEIIKFLSITVGIAVVGGIAFGGITYAMSQGNPAGAQKGIAIITNAIIGLLLYLLMFALLQFLVPGGVFST